MFSTIQSHFNCSRGGHTRDKFFLFLPGINATWWQSHRLEAARRHRVPEGWGSFLLNGYKPFLALVGVIFGSNGISVACLTIWLLMCFYGDAQPGAQAYLLPKWGTFLNCITFRSAFACHVTSLTANFHWCWSTPYGPRGVRWRYLSLSNACLLTLTSLPPEQHLCEQRELHR